MTATATTTEGESGREKKRTVELVPESLDLVLELAFADELVLEQRPVLDRPVVVGLHVG